MGPDFTIRIDDANGQRVQSVPEGAYTLLVRDLSAEHNFVLADKPAGLKLQVDSGVEFVGEKTFEIQLDRGAYGYACSPHWQIMNGTLTVFPAPVHHPEAEAAPHAQGGRRRGRHDLRAEGRQAGPLPHRGQGRLRSGTTSTSPARGSTAAPGSASPARRPGRLASRAARTATAATPSRSRAGCASASSP